VAAVVTAIKSHPNEQLELLVQRSDRSQVSLPVVPIPARDGKGAIGISFYTNSYIKHTKPDSLQGM
jgi:hypothetical protein